jgi:hypothetical protein
VMSLRSFASIFSTVFLPATTWAAMTGKQATKGKILFLLLSLSTFGTTSIAFCESLNEYLSNAGHHEISWNTSELKHGIRMFWKPTKISKNMFNVSVIEINERAESVYDINSSKATEQVGKKYYFKIDCSKRMYCQYSLFYLDWSLGWVEEKKFKPSWETIKGAAEGFPAYEVYYGVCK